MSQQIILRVTLPISTEIESSLMLLASEVSKLKDREVNLNEAILISLVAGLPLALKEARDAQMTGPEFINRIESLGEQLKMSAEREAKVSIEHELIRSVMEIHELMKLDPTRFSRDDTIRLSSIMKELTPYFRRAPSVSVTVH